MKKIFFIIASVSIISCQQKISNSSSNSDLLQQNLKGHIQHYEEISFITDSSGKARSQDSLILMYKFDSKGYQTNFNTLYVNGQVKNEQIINHYDNGADKEVI